MHGTTGTRVADGNLVMVTSALPGEGKTFTAVNLAMSVAMELDTTVLLVDGDVAHPQLPELLGVPHSPGLLDVLSRQTCHTVRLKSRACDDIPRFEISCLTDDGDGVR